jgi:toxin ParE1/3/4
MPEIYRTRESQADYEEIWDYIAKDNPIAADRVIDSVEQKLQAIAQSPEIGQLCEQYAASLRFLLVGSYLIFYRPVEDGIQLIRVIHGARDLPRQFTMPV